MLTQQYKAQPSKIICVGLNYRQHALELNMPIPTEPILFLKPPSSIIYNGDAIVYPAQSHNVHYEAELGIVMGERNEIAGYICANDVTARDLQAHDGQWTRAKSFDTFCPLGTTLVTGIDPNNLRIQAIKNGVVVQDSHTGDMIFDVPFIMAYISKIMTLVPGDVILTGTPQGVGPILPGDTIEIVIEHLGSLQNRVVQ